MREAAKAALAWRSPRVAPGVGSPGFSIAEPSHSAKALRSTGAMLQRCAWSRHSRVLLSPKGWRRLPRCLSAASTAAAEAQEQLAQLRDQLTEAVESAEMVGQSAAQLLLETDPAARGPREQYEAHYAELALHQLYGALDFAAHVRASLGPQADELIKQAKLALPLAEAQLWRDKTASKLAAVQRRAEENQIP